MKRLEPEIKIMIVSLLCLLVTISLLVACTPGVNEQDEIGNENGEEMDHGNMNMDDVHDMEKDSEKGEATLDRESFAEAPSSFNDRAEEHLLQTDTKNVTRINTDDPVEMSVRVSQVNWPSTHLQNQPGSVILIPLENWQVALASVKLIHHPNDGPVLYTVEGDVVTAKI